MKRKPKEPKLVKTSISIPDGLMKFAEGQRAKGEFSSFSAYLQHLIRREKDRLDTERPGAFPPSKSSRLELNEREAKERSE